MPKLNLRLFRSEVLSKLIDIKVTIYFGPKHISHIFGECAFNTLAVKAKGIAS